MKKFLACCLSLAALAACTPGGDDDDSGGSSGNADLRTFVERIYKAMCQWDERCASTAGRRYSNQAVCEADAVRWANLIAQYPEAGLTLGTQAQLDACVAEVAQAACSAVGDATGPACQQAIQQKNTLAGGALCHAPAQEIQGSCGQGFSCSTDSNHCGHCKADVAIGGVCASGDHCARGGFCRSSGGAGTCMALIAEGQACEYYGECAGNLTCDGPADAKTCRRRVGADASCEEAQCFQDLACSSASGAATCKPFPADGSACTYRSDPPCNGYCVFPSPSATSGTCQGFDGTLPSAGQACVGYGPYPACGAGTYSDAVRDQAGDVVSCECKPLKGAGAACSGWGECAGGLVCQDVDYSTNPVTPGTCKALLADGQPCTYSSECSSGTCDYQASPPVCVPAAVCQ